ncbi:hypothetical protein BD410DRAFT_90808 [Rickenella mellea]|uniref:Uncharacterized protein n=1 Tax=Rickenella mellea TaxID=50990 RepID=A0A4Y7QCB9_9AGAM|nr:hypothetical protein BD410DRAFT_90808 [Rickenella mellea]
MGSSSPSPINGFLFTVEPIQNTPTCGAASIDWTLLTPANVSTVMVDLFVAPFVPPPLLNMQHLANVSINIPSPNASESSTSTWIYQWSPVNVTQGIYVIQAFFVGGAATSFPFNVTMGDTTCLASTPASHVPPASQTPSPSPSPTSTARNLLQGGHKLGASDITAIILGTILFAVTAMAISVVCRRRSKPSHGPQGEKGYEGRSRRSFPGGNDSGEVVRLTPMPVDDMHNKSTRSQQDTVHHDVLGGRTIPIPPQPASNVKDHTMPYNSPKDGIVPSDVMTERIHRHRSEQQISSFLQLTDSTNSSMISDSM